MIHWRTPRRDVLIYAHDVMVWMARDCPESVHRPGFMIPHNQMWRLLSSLIAMMSSTESISLMDNDSIWANTKCYKILGAPTTWST